MSQPNTYVYTSFLEHCRPSAPSAPWSAAAQDHDVWRAPRDERAALRALELKHGRRKLLQSCLTVRDGYPPTFNSVLISRPNLILPLRLLPGHPVYNLLTDFGTVSETLPLQALANDYRVRGPISFTGTLYLTADVLDLVCLRALGLAAAPMYGLEEPNLETLDAVRTACGLSPIYSYLPLVQHLILVDWSPSKVSSRGSSLVNRVAENLVEWGPHLGLSPNQILRWRPRHDDMIDIVRCLQLQGGPAAVEAIESSVQSSAKPLVAAPDETTTSEEFFTAEKKFRDGLGRPELGRRRRNHRFKKYRQALEKELVEPMLEQAQATGDPQERLCAHLTVQMIRSLFPEIVRHQANLENEMASGKLIGEGASGDLANITKGIEAMIKLFKETS
jgi:hypothetical protein